MFGILSCLAAYPLLKNLPNAIEHDELLATDAKRRPIAPNDQNPYRSTI
jgi:hypothetical protein